MMYAPQGHHSRIATYVATLDDLTGQYACCTCAYIMDGASVLWYETRLHGQCCGVCVYCRAVQALRLLDLRENRLSPEWCRLMLVSAAVIPYRSLML